MLNAQEFIHQEYLKRKNRNPNYSMRAFARWLQVSPAQLSQMMTGKRSITLKTLKKINDRLGLSPSASQDLVNGLLKNKNLIQTPSQRSRELQEDQFRLVADWYHLAILSLTKVKNAKSDPRWIARRLGINVEEANQGLLRLERLGILQLKPEFKQIGEPFEIVSDIPSAAIRKYHKQNLELAMEKIETVDMKLRQFQSISFAMSPSLVAEFKEEIDIFLERIVDKAKSSQPEEVYHLNVQLIPVTTPIKE